MVIGVAGGGLEVANAGWAANADVARIGRAGELRTAEILDPLARRSGGATVLHDLTIPGSRANIDHVVVSGRRVTLIDSKVWKPAFYWTVFGRTFRGAQRFAHADKDTMVMASDRVAKALADAGVRAAMGRPLTVVWSSSRAATVRTTLLSVPGSRALRGERLAARAARVAAKPADPAVVAVLAGMCQSPAPTRPGPPRARHVTDSW